ncbi:accessory gene regulator B family protein [Moorellaceae bacterium AZ2]
MLKFNLTRPAAAYLKEKLQLTPEQEEIALYGLQTIVYPLTGLLGIILVGWLWGCLGTTLVAAFGAAFLRLWSGGAHSRSPLTCTLVGMAVFPSMGKIADLAAPATTVPVLHLVLAAGLAVCLSTVYRLAPVDSPAKPILSADYRRNMRRLSVAAVLLITATQVALLKAGALNLVLALSLGLWWQTFSLTRAGHRFAASVDKLSSLPRR